MTGGQRLETQLDIDKFLMFELSEVCKEIEDQKLRAYAIAMTISAVGDSIQESWIRLYLSQCPVEKNEMDIHLAVFQGMGLLDIACDCEGYNPSCMPSRFKMHSGYVLGEKYKANNSVEYKGAKSRVDALRSELT